MSKSDLRIDWATFESAKFACEKWHYSKCVPAGKLVRVGAWEQGEFIGVVLFGRGANNRLAAQYGLDQSQACELVRVALRCHVAPVTRIVAMAIRFLKAQSPGLRLVISYADPQQGHHGAIYQAGNWIYVGTSIPQQHVIVNGKAMHKRSAAAKFGTIKGLLKSETQWKHKYLMPLDSAMRKQIESLSRPYPKRVRSADGGTLSNPVEKGQFESDPNASQNDGK